MLTWQRRRWGLPVMRKDNCRVFTEHSSPIGVCQKERLPQVKDRTVRWKERKHAVTPGEDEKYF